MSYVTKLADTRKALSDARRWTKPLDAETAAVLRERMPEQWADAQRKMAEITATIPGLEATLAELEARACGRCNGHGVYAGASNWTNRQGQKVCFACHGRGCRK